MGKINVFSLFDALGIKREECTPEWNIHYYETLLKYTKKSVLCKKHLEELKWWKQELAYEKEIKELQQKNS